MTTFTPYIKRLLIACPSSVQTQFGAPDNCFETVGSTLYLRLPLDRGNYDEIKTYGSGAAGWTRTFGVPVFSLRSYERGINIKVVDERLFFYDILKQLSLNSTSGDLRRKTTIQMLDFVLPESADRAAAIAASPQYEPYTVRYGTLSEPKANGGAVGLGAVGGWIKGGCTVKFLEAGLRYE